VACVAYFFHIPTGMPGRPSIAVRRFMPLIVNLSQSQEVTPLSPYSIMRWLLESGFKHALIQDAAYENLLKSRRQFLHRRLGDTLRENLSTAVAQPELLAHHFTRAGLIEEAIEWWGKAGQQSLERSALAEAAAQLIRALDQIAAIPGTPTLRRQQIKLQVALITPLMHVKGYTAVETREAVENARLLIEQAEMRGEPPDHE
jgi:predicted ATPase